MRKWMMMVAAALLLTISAAQAQRVNKDAILAKLEKSAVDIADSKKNTKAATWISRGKVYYEAAIEPTKNIFLGMDAPMLKLAIGDAEGVSQETVNGAAYDVVTYPYFKIYIKDAKVAAWDQTQSVKDGLIEEAIASYAKAYELDPKSAEKIKLGLQQIVDYCAQVSDVNYNLGFVKRAADAYALAYKAQSVPAYGKAEPQLVYNAGFLETVNGANDLKSFERGIEYLNRAIAEGFEGEDGAAYYYLFHCYYGLKTQDAGNLQKAKNELLIGIGKYPKSERILDGLMSLYTTEQGMGDPADLIVLIEEAIARDPENVDMWFGRGRIYAALKNNDECIVSFRKISEIAPAQFDGYYWAGFFHIAKADVMLQELNDKPWTGEAAYNEELKAVNNAYMEAIPWLERAHELNMADVSTVEYIKQLSFRLRDEEGMMDKYNKYNELLKTMQK